MIQRGCLMLAFLLTALALWRAPLHPQPDAIILAAAAAPAKQVQLTLKIADEESGLEVQAKRPVVSGTSGLEAMQSTVPVKVKEYPGLGIRILGICNVEPARGKYWALYVDGEYAEAGIANLKIEKDTVIEWKTKK